MSITAAPRHNQKKSTKEHSIMSIRAIFAACILTSAFMPAGAALATSNPIPGVDIIVKKNPGGQAIRVGDCQAGGGKIVKQGTKWVCTGMRASGASSAGTKAEKPKNDGPAGAPINTSRSNIKRPN